MYGKKLMREIVLDTETTGMDPYTGDRIIEIGCLELINHMPTGNAKQWYLNPEREVPLDAVRIHGITTEFLIDKPKFIQIADDFLSFIEDSKLIIHNAAFDMKFINAELDWADYKNIKMPLVLDTLEMARKKFPGKRNSLDALCQRFNINNSHRTLHGALLDAEILAEVYLELIGGKEPSFSLENIIKNNKNNNVEINNNKQYFNPRNFEIPQDELENHNNFIEQKIKSTLWKEV